MTRIVVLDDDRIVRQYIRATLEKTEGEFQLAGEASGGRNGLALIEELKPDMLILDIEMPSMNGIELLAEMERRGLKIKTLILSCHDEFEYVRQAMKLGAADYLLKHKIDDKTLLEALRTLREKPITMYAPDSGINNSEEKSKQFGELLTGKMSGEEQESAFRQFASDNQITVVCVAEIDYLKAFIWKNGKEQGAELEKKVWKKIRTTPIQECKSYYYRAEPGYYAFLLVFGELPVSRLETRQKLYNIISNYVAGLTRECQVTITAGISEQILGGKRVKYQWFHAREALERKFYIGCAHLIFYEEVGVLKENEEAMNLLLDGLRSQAMNRQEAVLAVEELFENIRTAPMPLNRFQKFFYIFLNILMQMISRMNLEIEDIFKNVDFVNEALETLETFEDYHKWFLDAINSIFDAAQKAAQGGVRKEVAKAIEYIRENYMKEISLDDVAKYVCVSKTYFSSMFKKEAGQKFSLYLLDFRLEKACVLLRQGNKKIYNIAYDVGFQSHNYFNNIFKERYGMTPKEYRKRYR
ncbi:response regulator transcription factor [Muricomes intestini]|uniref:response regulator transcription factor n=1 Tax=Muricomes intestini TaxID=1796634 RepID=UPI002FDFE969